MFIVLRFNLDESSRCKRAGQLSTSRRGFLSSSTGLMLRDSEFAWILVFIVVHGYRATSFWILTDSSCSRMLVYRLFGRFRSLYAR